MNIVIIDYGMGNIRSIIGALKYLGVENVRVSNNSKDLKEADKLILPGVGSFSMAMRNIKALRLDQYLKHEVIEKKKPVLGICLGMQLMGKSSQEEGFSYGLGFINSKVEILFNIGIKVPHVGFNQVRVNKESVLFDGISNLSDFYFTHSFQMQSNEDINQATCSYGNEFIVSYELDNIVGVQFHPELSQTNGLKLLDNFIKSA